MRKYLEKHLRRCLPKEEREAMFREHLKPDLPVCSPPKVDKYMSDFLGNKIPKDYDREFLKAQAAVLACVRPLASAWQQLMEGGSNPEEEMTVPVSEVLTLIQCTLCMVGNAWEQISRIRGAKILESIDKSWMKFAEEELEPEEGALFGGKFQTTLMSGVEKDNTIAKALSITKRSKKQSDTSSSRRGDRRSFRFFRGSPTTQYGSGRGRHPYSYSQYQAPRKMGESSRSSSFQPQQRQSNFSRFHEPKLPPHHSKTQPGKP